MKIRSLLFFVCIILAGQINAQKLLSNTGFEGTYTTYAPSWSINRWSGATVAAERAIGAGITGDCQKLTLTTAGGALFYQNVDLTPGKIYQAKIWIKAETTTKVSFFTRIQDASCYYFQSGGDYIDIGTEWAEYTFKLVPYYDTGADHRICIQLLDTDIPIYLDDASLTEITDQYEQLDTSERLPVKNVFFGLHINKGHEGIWPGIDHGLIRMWDTGTRWLDLEGTQKGTWNWTRFDLYMNLITNNNPDCKVMYTLGIIPTWARSDAITTMPPDDLSDWDDYVTAVATRYKGKIKYYEIWNECNYSTFYSGNLSDLVELAERAYNIIKSIDPEALVITPNFTRSGLVAFSNYLYYGGGQYADILSYHIYYSYDNILNSKRLIIPFKDIAERHGLGDLPVFITEGAATIPGSSTPTITEETAAVAQGYILNQSYGSDNFSYYFWEPNDSRVDLSDADHETILEPGIAYRAVVNWLTGARIDNTNTSYLDSLVKVEINRGAGYQGYILWSLAGNVTFTPPVDWNVDTINYLDETDSAYTSGSITIGIEPVLLETNPLKLPNKLAHWKMENNSGSTEDSSIFGNNLTTTGVGTADCIYNQGAVFNGYNGSYGTINHNSSLTPENLTISFWYRHEQAQTGYEKVLVSKSSYGNKQGYYFHVDSSDNIRLRLYDGTANGWQNAQVSITPDSYNQWYHISATFDGQYLKIYQDGILQQTKDLDSSFSIVYGSNDLFTGKYFKGNLDDIRIYNYALTETEIKSLSAMVSHWKLDSINAVDCVGNNTVTVGSAVTTATGISDNALKFDGSSNSYLQIADDDSLKPAQMTISMWIKPDTTFLHQGSTYKSIFSKSSWDNRSGYYLFAKNDGKIYWRLYDGTNYGWLTNGEISTHANDTEWLHLVATFDGSNTLRIYLNGTIVKEKVTSSTFNLNSSTNNVSIAGTFSGLVDDIRFYNTALPANLIEDIYFNESR